MVNSFSEVIIIICTVLFFIDWYMSESGRERLREKVGDLWLYISYKTFPEILAISANRAILLFELVTGRGNIIHKFARILLFCAIISWWPLLAFMTADIDANSNQAQAMFKIIQRQCLYNFAFSLLSTVLSIKILKRISILNDTRSIIIFLYIDCGIVCGSAIAATFLSIAPSMPDSNSSELLFNNIDIDILQGNISILILFLLYLFGFVFGFFILPIATYFILIDLGSLFSVGLFLAIFSGSIPSLINVMFEFIFLFMRYTHPISKPIIMKILYAFHDSKKGVLSTIAVAIGSIALLAQGYYK